MESQIEAVLEKEIRPLLAMHRGNAHLVSFQNGVVSLRFQGMCKGCPLSTLTLKEGIESILKEKISGIERVDAVE